MINNFPGLVQTLLDMVFNMAFLSSQCFDTDMFFFVFLFFLQLIYLMKSLHLLVEKHKYQYLIMTSLILVPVPYHDLVNISTSTLSWPR